MTLLRLLACACALAVAAVAAQTASAAVPLAGTGENIAPIARLPIPHPNEVELAGDWAFVSDDGSYTERGGGLIIVNIADPSKPFIQGKWACDAGWGDVDISPDANIAVLTNAHGDECLSEKEETWVAIIDISDKSNPKLLSRIVDDDEIEYVHTSTLDNKLLYLNPQAWAGYPQGQNPHIPIYDISDPRKPVRKGFVESTGVGLAHDTYIDHRPDGKSLMYSASIHTSDIFDLTDPFKSEMLQRTTSPEYTISHDMQPNWKRDVIVVDDEGAAGGQIREEVSVCGKEGTGSGPTNLDSGSIHFFEANPDGTFAGDGMVELGSFNAPTNVATGACVAHVFWQAPSENRLTQAYYRTGAFAVDFEDPANPKLLGDFHAEGGGNYWSNKPHNGYMYATNQDTTAGGEPGSLDILRYTGEGGKRWPATAGPAEVQRSARQGVPYVPLTGARAPQGGVLPSGPVSSRSIGRIRFTAELGRLPGPRGKRVTVNFVFRKGGKRVGSARVKRAAGKRAEVKIFGGAVTGRYTWTAKVGKRTVGRGKLLVKKSRMTLAPNRTLSVGAK